MTDRIHTIPARELVPGLRLLVDGVPRGTVRRVWVWKQRIRAQVGAVQWIWEPGTSVVVCLPGPSPREVLCTCLESDDWRELTRDQHHEPASDWLASVAPDDHMELCPVREMRLRLWPVGAEWDAMHEVWLVPIEGVAPWSLCADELASGFQEYDEDAQDMLRAAFCEPEPTT